jgi:hypothetical protein
MPLKQRSRPILTESIRTFDHRIHEKDRTSKVPLYINTVLSIWFETPRDGPWISAVTPGVTSPRKYMQRQDLCRYHHLGKRLRDPAAPNAHEDTSATLGGFT